MQSSIKEINKLLKPISYQLIDNEFELILKSKFTIWNKSIFGSLLILCGGAFMTYITIIKLLSSINYDVLEDMIPLLIFGALSIILLLSGILGVFAASTDFVKVNPSSIQFKSLSLKPTTIKLNSNFNIIKRSFSRRIKRVGTIGSTFRVIELYIVVDGQRKRMLFFQMDERDSALANKLGEQLKSIILRKKSQFNS